MCFISGTESDYTNQHSSQQVLSKQDKAAHDKSFDMRLPWQKANAK